MNDEFGNPLPPPQAGGTEIEQPWGTPVNTGYPPQTPPPGGYAPPPPVYQQQGYAQQPPPGYAPPPGYQQQPGYGATPPQYAAAPAGSGLSDTAAGAIAYITIIPAIIFLVMDPYKDKPFVKFHSLQSLGLAVIWVCLAVVLTVVSIVLHFVPFLGLLMLILYPVTYLALFVLWILCILKASQGGSFKLPLVGDFAAKQSGYHV